MAIEKIDYDLCIGCGICVQACAVDVIRMDEETKKPVIAYPSDCMLCDMCVVHCKVGAITITPKKDRKVLMSWG